MKIIRTTDFDINQCEEVELPNDKYEAMSLVKSIIGGYLEDNTVIQEIASII